MGSDLKHEPESDADSMAEYGDGDTGELVVDEIPFISYLLKQFGVSLQSMLWTSLILLLQYNYIHQISDYSYFSLNCSLAVKG